MWTPKRSLCMWRADKEETRIVIRLETRRFSKTTTIIEGIDPKLSDIQHIVKELKSKLFCGGTAKTDL